MLEQDRKLWAKFGEGQGGPLDMFLGAIYEARAYERERCAKIVESTTVVMDGIVIESLNANRSEMVRRIRELK